MKALVFVPDTILWLFGQMPLAGLMMVSKWSWRVLGVCYYEVAKLRRWAKGEKLWQEHDRSVGHHNPEEMKKFAEKHAKARVWHNEFADHARGCDACWPVFSGGLTFEFDEKLSGRCCDIGNELRKRLDEALSIAA